MQFWEAMKALEEGKKVRHCGWGLDRYADIDNTDLNLFYTIGNTSSKNNYLDGWEIVEEPELYWQWRIKRSGVINRAGLQKEVKGIDQLEKHAGPWIKTEDGFKKADNWEQY